MTRHQSYKIIVFTFKLFSLPLIALQGKLNEEKTARQRAESVSQEKDRQMSMLSVDYRQMQQRLQKLEGEHRQESEKVIMYNLNNSPFILIIVKRCSVAYLLP